MIKKTHMLKAIIVDDEKNSRETLKLLLEKYCPEVEVVALSGGYKEALKDIYYYKPDLLFLDIQMPDGSGFKLLEEIEEVNFFVIFTTAYEQYAIKAIKINAIDYLLKPIIPKELAEAVKKVQEKLSTDKSDIKNIQKVLAELRQQNSGKKIVLSTIEGMHVVNTEDIIRCESDDYYTKFFFTDKTSMLISKTLKEHEELLADNNFFRPHKSHLINLKYFKTYVKSDGVIIMTNGDEVPVSRRKRDKVLEILSHLK